LDHLGDNTENVFLWLTQDENIWFAFRSPSGDGIKCGIRAEGIQSDDDIKRLYSACERYFKETYGLRDSVFQSIKPCLTIEKNLKPCISINYTNQEGLSKHPYVRYKLARAICLYRENNGLFQHIEDLKKLPNVNDSIYIKLLPYITVNNL
jgi:DNA uptake protein ComE-like DNA-binding protein